MTRNEFGSRIKKSLTLIISIAVWLLLWELLSRLVDIDFVFPGVVATFRRLFELVITTVFWRTVLYSLGRILLGLLLGVAIGVLLSTVCKLLPFAYPFISIGITAIKSTPVASIVMLMWVIIGSANLPTVIAIMMVTPVIWQNLIDGYNAIDKNLIEVAQIFNFSKKKTFRYVYMPALLRYFIPACLTSVGLAWKSGIAAEVIAYTRNSIGKYIYNAKTTFEGDSLLAWTLVVIFISLAFEALIKYLYRRITERNASA